MMLNLIFLTIWLINLGLVLYAKAMVHVATWLFDLHAPQGGLCCFFCQKALLNVLSPASNGTAVDIDG